MITKPTQIKSVADAAKYLDHKLPGWYKNITQTIHMPSCKSCVLGQNGDFESLVQQLGLFRNREWLNSIVHPIFAYAKYNQDWEAEVQRRKDADNAVVSHDIHWAIQQLEAGNNVECDGAKYDAKIKPHFFCSEKVLSKNWKLTKLTLTNIKIGEKFKCLNQTFMKIVYNGDAIFLNIEANTAVSLTGLSQSLSSANVEIERV